MNAIPHKLYLTPDTPSPANQPSAELLGEHLGELQVTGLHELPEAVISQTTAMNLTGGSESCQSNTDCTH